MCERLARIHRVDRPIGAGRHVAVHLFIRLARPLRRAIRYWQRKQYEVVL